MFWKGPQELTGTVIMACIVFRFTVKPHFCNITGETWEAYRSFYRLAPSSICGLSRLVSQALWHYCGIAFRAIELPLEPPLPGTRRIPETVTFSQYSLALAVPAARCLHHKYLSPPFWTVHNSFNRVGNLASRRNKPIARTNIQYGRVMAF